MFYPGFLNNYTHTLKNIRYNRRSIIQKYIMQSFNKKKIGWYILTSENILTENVDK